LLLSSSIIIIKYLSSIVTSGWRFREIKKDTVPAWKALSSKLDKERTWRLTKEKDRDGKD